MAPKPPIFGWRFHHWWYDEGSLILVCLILLLGSALSVALWLYIILVALGVFS